MSLERGFSKWMSMMSRNIITILLALVACTRDGGYDAPLAKADSLMNIAPDSALYILDTLEASSQDFPQSTLRRWQLLRLMAQNKCDTVFRSDSLQLVLANYYDHHGTPNERMAAYYLLGRTYSDMGEVPRALQCYQDAVACADTASLECDYNTLFRIYGQIALIYRSQCIPGEELAAWNQYCRFALKSGDIYGYIHGMELTVGPYYDMGDTVSCLRITERCRKEYLEQSMPEKAASVYPTAIYIHLLNANYEKAREMMAMFEGESCLFDSCGNISKGRESYYYSKGLYYLGIHQIDSAELYFRKLQKVHLNKDFQANKGLLSLYLHLNNKDSISKYAALYEKSVDDLLSENQAEAVAQAAASNKYGRLQKESKEMAVITEKSKWTSTMLLLLILVLICTFMTLSLLALCGFYVLRNRKNKVINQKIREIELLQGTIVRMEEGKESPNDHLEEFEESDIVIHLRQKAEKKESANVAELTDLKDAAIKHIPVFIQTLGNTSYELQRHETYLCILIKAGFRPSEIAILMNMTPQNISNLRARLNKKMFHTDNGAKDFNEKIINLTSS
ncbi:MAG: hypothetical protein IKR05_03370 [Prevotella sp.]|nr:hypothetical protein [Prevotella sp.]